MKLLAVACLTLFSLVDCEEQTAAPASKPIGENKNLTANLNDTLAGAQPGTKQQVVPALPQLGLSNVNPLSIVPQQQQPLPIVPPQQQPSVIAPQPQPLPYLPQPQPMQYTPQLPQQPQIQYVPQPIPVFIPQQQQFQGFPQSQSRPVIIFPPRPQQQRSSSSNAAVFFVLWQYITRTGLFAAVTTAVPTTTGPFSGWTSHQNCRYLAYRAAATANTAASTCTGAGTGARLATENMKTEADRVALLTALGFSFDDIVWTGITDNNGNGMDDATFVDGTTYTPASGTDEFLNGANPSCGYYSVNSASATKISFTNCDTATQMYICEVCP